MSTSSVDVSRRELLRVLADLLVLGVGTALVVEVALVGTVLAPRERWVGSVAALAVLAGYAYWRLYHTDLGDRLRTAVEELTGTEL